MLGVGGSRHSYEETPVHEWSAEQVAAHIRTLPPTFHTATLHVASFHSPHPLMSSPSLPRPRALAPQVIEWLSTVDGGRFSQVVVPKGTDGKALLRMSAKKLTDLVETENTEGREDGEGWYVSAQARVGRALFAALRDAQRANGIRRH